MLKKTNNLLLSQSIITWEKAKNPANAYDNEMKLTKLSLKPDMTFLLENKCLKWDDTLISNFEIDVKGALTTYSG